jgi:hypothetical protein
MASTLSFSLQSVSLVPSKDFTFNIHVILPPFLVLPYLSFTYLCFLILSLVFAFEGEYLTYS